MHNYIFIYLCSLIIFDNIKLILNEKKYSDQYITPPLKLFGAIEAGGTKMVCAVVDVFGNIVEEKIIPTTTPEETANKMIQFFSKYELSSLGIGTFGPVDLNEKSLAGYKNAPPPREFRSSTSFEAWASSGAMTKALRELSSQSE